MLSSSMKDVLKALSSLFGESTVPRSLPKDVQHVIESFLERHEDVEESESQRLHDDLLHIYRRDVSDKPEKHNLFVSVLRLLNPAILGEARIGEWYDLVIRPTMTVVGHKRDEIENARGFLVSVLVYDSDDDPNAAKARVSRAISRRLLDTYLVMTKIPTSKADAITPEDEFVAHELESVLVAFGRRKPKELLIALDELLVQKIYRFQALSLLSAFVRTQPPHLYLVLETALLQNLQKCLMIDTSVAVIELALTVLIMFLPHITNSLVPQLPRLFLIYSRLLCWDRIQPASNAPSDSSGPNEEIDYEIGTPEAADGGWESLHDCAEATHSTTPSLLHYFTFLYGLFPHSFTSFIRKPRKFLRSVEFPGAEDFDLDQDLIKSRTAQYRQVHLLHPNFYSCTPEDELDGSRWLKSEPADVVTECMGLCVAVSSTLGDPGPPPTSKLPDLPLSASNTPSIKLQDNDGSMTDQSHSPSDTKSVFSWRNTSSTTVTAPSIQGDSDSSAPYRKHSRRNHTTSSNKSSKPASPVLRPRDPVESPTIPNDVPEDGMRLGPSSIQHSPNPSRKASAEHLIQHGPQETKLEAFAYVLSAGSPQGLGAQPDQYTRSIASLQQELMLLRNDLNFERYLKHQHLNHIGQLQRKTMKEATSEAETQNLINTNRTLKSKLTKANNDLTQLRKETTLSRNHSKKWEGELSSKVRSLRDEQRAWHTDEEVLRSDLERVRGDCEKLRRLVVESEARELKSKQRLNILEQDLEDLEALKREADWLREQVSELRLSKEEGEDAKREVHNLRTALGAANAQIQVRDADRQRTVVAFEQMVADLEARVEQASRQPLANNAGQLPQSVQQMIDSALTASNAKLQNLKRTHRRLNDRYVELEMRYQELEAERESNTNYGDVRPQTADTNRTAEPQSPSSIVRSPGAISAKRRSIGDYSSAFAFPSSKFADNTRPEEDSYYDPYGGGQHSAQNYSAGLPVRLESIPATGLIDDSRFKHTFPLSYESTLSPQFTQPPISSSQALQRSHTKTTSGGKSFHSTDSSGSAKDDKKAEKIKPSSGQRIYGRGGAQNIGKKKDAKAPEKEKTKSSGFKGLKGFI